jgi:hypothetical protein
MIFLALNSIFSISRATKYISLFFAKFALNLIHIFRCHHYYLSFHLLTLFSCSLSLRYIYKHSILIIYMNKFIKLKSRIGVFLSSNNALLFRLLRSFLQIFYFLFSSFKCKKVVYSLSTGYLKNFKIKIPAQKRYFKLYLPE